MAVRSKLIVGRQTVNHNVEPNEADYVRVINEQMDAVRKNLQTVIGAIEDASPEGLEYALTPMFNTSQRLVPVKTGRLKRSGFLEAVRTSYGARVAIGYGRGGHPSYAAIVHERMDFAHKAPTQAKYLEEAVNRHLGNVSRRYRDYIRGRTGLTD